MAENTAATSNPVSVPTRIAESAHAIEVSRSHDNSTCASVCSGDSRHTSLSPSIGSRRILQWWTMPFEESNCARPGVATLPPAGQLTWMRVSKPTHHPKLRAAESEPSRPPSLMAVAHSSDTAGSA